MTAPKLSPEEAAIVARFDAAPVLPEVCRTCRGRIRETVGMVCQTCGTDYAAPETYTWQVHEVPVPVSGDVQRELAEALAHANGVDLRQLLSQKLGLPDVYDQRATKLLPTIQALIADAEKRAAARALRDMAETFDADANHLGILAYAHAAEDCRDHAATLERRP